ncbi:hypothetical protein [Bradyrhizobium sp. AZCC 2230]|uniref:hypothetical protein n=1 Tax=Bradyrhizobium sp. AZCC 2230 TaxID=3117021 RepID=UPI002FEFF455
MTKAALARALAALVREMKAYSRLVEPARLTVWSYEPNQEVDFKSLWDVFGKAAWIELIPRRLVHKDRPTRLHIQERVPRLLPLIHLIGHSIYNERKTSSLVLPLRNFKSKFLQPLDEFWYRDHDVDALRRSIDASNSRFRQHHRGVGAGHQDSRRLLFKGARDEECHGQAHPIGDAERCFVEGRFRFGAALFPGFHFDVTSNLGTLNCTLYDCQDAPRDMWPERRQYVNIFPNDHILPARAQ